MKRIDTDTAILYACIAWRLNGGRVLRRGDGDYHQRVFGSDRPPAECPPAARPLLENKGFSIYYDPADSYVRYTISRRGRGPNSTFNVYRHSVTAKANRTLMHHINRNIEPAVGATPADRALAAQIRETVRMWKFDLMSGKASDFDRLLMRVLKQDTVSTALFGLLAELPRVVRQSRIRSEFEARVAAECGDCPHAPGTRLRQAEFEAVRPVPSFRVRRNAVNGFVTDGAGAYPAWFYCRAERLARIAPGTRWRINARVRRITADAATGVAAALLRRVHILDELEPAAGAACN